MKYSAKEIIELIRKNESELRKFWVLELYLFGSVARGEATDKSDVDFFVVLDERGADLFNLIGLNQFLEDLFGTKVDLGTKKSLRKAIRDQVLQEAIRVA